MTTALDLPADFDLATALSAAPVTPSRRADGWTAERQCAFCGAVAAGQTVEGAARSVGLSASSAYAFRNSAAGAAFALGWAAANLLQRQRLADAVAARAFEGQTVTLTRADGTTVERHYYDNRLAMSVLTRLDRLAAGLCAGGGADASGEGQAARVAAGEFDRYLDLLARDASPAQAGLFLAVRGPAGDPAVSANPAHAAAELAQLAHLARADQYLRAGTGIAAEIDVSDLDPAHRAHWTAAQWARAEAAGLLALAPEPVPAPDPAPVPAAPDGTFQHSQRSRAHDVQKETVAPVWFDEDEAVWVTRFPPSVGFDNYEWGDYGDPEYRRVLSDEEAARVADAEAADLADRRTLESAERDTFFAELLASVREAPPQNPISPALPLSPAPAAPAAPAPAARGDRIAPPSLDGAHPVVSGRLQ